MAQWLQTVVKIRTSNEEFYRLFRQALEDMAALRLPITGTDHMVFLPAAGLPWFVAPFGRDSLIVSLQNILIYPEFARGALEILGSLQAKEDDPYRDAEPGKILHEMRYGELAHFKLIPHTPYYGTADATPLYLITLHAAWRATGDQELLERHLETAEGCLSWIDKYGDRDGDGFQEYQTRSPVGYENMGWKDFGDASCIRTARWSRDPRRSASFRAMSTMPGCAWPRYSMRSASRSARTELRDQGGGPVRAVQRSLLGRGTRVLCLCARRRQEEGADRCIQCRALPVVRHRAARARKEGGGAPDGAGHVDRMGHSHAVRRSSGIQSVQLSDRLGLAARQRHHRDGLQAAMAFAAEAARIAHDISVAASHFLLNQLPELYTAFERDGTNFPVQYIGANVPQAWAAGSVFMLTQAILGFLPDAPRNKLYVDPSLPAWLPDLTVRDLRIGKHKLDIRFWREGEQTAFEVIKGDASWSSGAISRPRARG